MAVRRIAIPTTVDCPHCREKNPLAEARCQACGKALLVYIGPAEMLPRRVGLGSLMLVVAVIAPCFVVLREAPPLGVPLLLIVVPALVRTLGAVSTRQSDGRPMTPVDKLGTFIASVGIVWLISLAALLAGGMMFILAGAATEIIGSIVFGESPRLMSSQWGLLVLTPVALLTGAAVIYSLGRRLWAIRN